MTAYPIIELRAVAVRYAAALFLALPALPACAQLPPELRIPETTRVLRLESHQTCPGCPAWYYELYADGSWSYEGIDAVFMLGEAGTKRFWDGFRNAPPPTDPQIANSEGFRESARRTLGDYRARVANNAKPESVSARLHQAMRVSDFGAWRSEYPADLGDGMGRPEPVLSIQINLDSKSKSVRFVASSAPPDLARLVDQILTIGDPFFVGPRYWIQRAPVFRGDADAALWVARRPGGTWKTFSVVFYRSGKATISGWNHVGLQDLGYQTHTAQLGADRVQKLLADLGSAERRSSPSHVYENPDEHSIVDMVLGGRHGDYRLIQKGRSGRLQGTAQGALENLKRVVDEMLPLFGPDDPARMRLPALPASK